MRGDYSIWSILHLIITYAQNADFWFTLWAYIIYSAQKGHIYFHYEPNEEHSHIMCIKWASLILYCVHLGLNFLMRVRHSFLGYKNRKLMGKHNFCKYLYNLTLLRSQYFFKIKMCLLGEGGPPTAWTIYYNGVYYSGYLDFSFWFMDSQKMCSIGLRSGFLAIPKYRSFFVRISHGTILGLKRNH